MSTVFKRGNAFSSSNRANMMSNFSTVKNQGGGEKKAGFPYQVGRESWSSIFIHSVDPINGRCCNLEKIGTNMVFTKNTVRPIGNDPRIPMR